MYSPLFRRYCEIGTTARRDPVYMSVLVSLLINQVQKNGKKNLAATAVYSSLDAVRVHTSAPQVASKYPTRPPEEEGPSQQSGTEAKTKRSQEEGRKRPQVTSAVHYLSYAVQYVAPQIVFKSSKARFGRRTKLGPIETRSFSSVKPCRRPLKKTFLYWFIDRTIMRYPILTLTLLSLLLEKICK